MSDKNAAALRTLESLGYTYHGGELWKPPLGKPSHIGGYQPKPSADHYDTPPKPPSGGSSGIKRNGAMPPRIHPKTILMPVICQNGHTAVASYVFDPRYMEWVWKSVPREQQCGCPKMNAGQGYRANGNPYIEL